MRPRRAHGPALQERDLAPVDAGDRLLDRVRARGRDPIERPFHSGGTSTVLDGRRLRNRAEQATGGDGATGCGGGRELPAPVSRQRLTHGAAGEEIRRGCERAQHAVEDAAEQAGPQLRRERQPTAPDWLSGSQPARVLVDLDGRAVAIHRDDLARQASLADRDDLEHAAPCIPAASTTEPLTRSTLPVTPQRLDLRSELVEQALDERRQRGVDPSAVRHARSRRPHRPGRARSSRQARGAHAPRPRAGPATPRSQVRLGARGRPHGLLPQGLVGLAPRTQDASLGLPALRWTIAAGRRARSGAAPLLAYGPRAPPRPRAPPPARPRHARPPLRARPQHGSARRRASSSRSGASVRSAASTTPFPASVRALRERVRQGRCSKITEGDVLGELLEPARNALRIARHR